MTELTQDEARELAKPSELPQWRWDESDCYNMWVVQVGTLGVRVWDDNQHGELEEPGVAAYRAELTTTASWPTTLATFDVAGCKSVDDAKYVALYEAMMWLCAKSEEVDALL